ncbi:MAG: hypothetical protein II797_05875 [Clostridia bacterium]|nr:hypothetical protein [Clostridia bacterium]
MVEKSTTELDKLLESTHPAKLSNYLEENKDSLIEGEHSFSSYLKEILKKNGLLLQEVFLAADIPERYGYKLVSGEKRTKQRDVILRICYGAQLTLEETQRALKVYGLPTLYSRVPRDAALIICFTNRPGSILEVNAYLKKNHFLPLRSSGVLD